MAFQVLKVLPSAEMRRSPGRRPAAAAGEPLTTWATVRVGCWMPPAWMNTNMMATAATKFMNGPAKMVMLRCHTGLLM